MTDQPMSEERLAEIEAACAKPSFLETINAVPELVAEVRRLRAQLALAPVREDVVADMDALTRERDEALARVKELEARSDD